MSDAFRVFIGWDSREAEAFEVCRHSLQRRASIPLDVQPIRLDALRRAGLYTREDDPRAATEFTYSRFLTPLLAGYRGAALYCDCDFLWLADVAELAAQARSDKAVACVQHDHRPTERVKMDGRAQDQYPRKNWSSLMLFNCEHPATRTLTQDCVNTQSGAYLHRMAWAADNEIGAIDQRWNWLEGWNEKPATGAPAAIHFTRGGPWFEAWRDVDYASEWLAERDHMRAGG